MGQGAVDPDRRALLRGQTRRTPRRPLPPWAAADLFFDACTRCGACVEVCETGLLAPGDGGYPEADFAAAECTFCGACAEACPEPVFGPTTGPPWSHRPRVGRACLAAQGVLCSSCRDACPERAIRIAPRLGGAGLPRILDDACTGCGACVSACPTDAVLLRNPETVDG